MTTNNCADYSPVEYNVISGGANGAINNIVPSTSGYVLTSNGASLQPSFQPVGDSGAVSSVYRQVFTYTGSTQTYTPTSGMIYCDIEVVAGGGGGGGAASTSSSQVANGGGGGGGGYARGIFSATTIGASQTITIGAAGTAGGSGAGTGGTGGTTSVGSLISATGGIGGTNNNSPATSAITGGGSGGSGIGGDFQTMGNPGGSGIGANDSTSISFAVGGYGGSSFFGGGALSQHTVSGANNGNSAVSYGGGGSGGVSAVGSGTANGGAGYAGICIVTEYIA